MPGHGSPRTLRQPRTGLPVRDFSADLLARIDAYWRAANYLSVGQIYLLDNPLLKAIQARARKTAVIGPLGDHAWIELRLRSPQPRYQGAGPERDFHHRSGARRTWLRTELAELAPTGHRRTSDNPHANGGLWLRDLKIPDFRNYEVKVGAPGSVTSEATRVMGSFLRDVMQASLSAANFRLFSPDENNSNSWQDVLEVTDVIWLKFCQTMTISLRMDA